MFDMACIAICIRSQPNSTRRGFGVLLLIGEFNFQFIHRVFGFLKLRIGRCLIYLWCVTNQHIVRYDCMRCRMSDGGRTLALGMVL